MKLREIDDILDAFPKGRTKYFYFKDKYAIDLLSYAFDDSSIDAIKRSQYSGLLKKPIVRQRLSSIGTNRLRSDDWVDVWSNDVEPYLLTLGKWGHDKHGERYYYQTTNTDANLVLQLNFSNLHNSAFRRYVGDGDRNPYAFYGHPIAPAPYYTLAWARLDLSLDTNEALIEEIQTDWIRKANSEKAYLDTIPNELTSKERHRLHYLSECLAPHVKIWQEAILAAAIWFIYREIGISRIYYHSHKSGCRLKGIEDRLPPRSLYETLPRKFCFEAVDTIPEFLIPAIRKKKIKPRFYFLDLGV
ncbi:hypothetical protein MLD52_12470 [Puniceicoccaceae bacterium K14]|nr:hypothetical protein [Puniceicoccaceae bacterium K14]